MKTSEEHLELGEDFSFQMKTNFKEILYCTFGKISNEMERKRKCNNLAVERGES